MSEYISYGTGLNSVWKRLHSFWDVPVGDMSIYLCESRPCVEKIIVIAHNARVFDIHFILKNYSSEMASVDHERNKNYVHASGAYSVPRQQFVSTLRVT